MATIEAPHLGTDHNINITPVDRNQVILAIDIDGALVIQHDPNNPTPGFQQHSQEIPNKAYNPAHGIWLQGLVDTDDVGIHYQSTMGPLSHKYIGEKLKLKPLPFIRYSNAGMGVPEDPVGRSEALTELFPGCSIIWVDDILGADQEVWAAKRNREHAPTYLVRTNAACGLTSPQMRHISRLVISLTAARS